MLTYLCNKAKSTAKKARSATTATATRPTAKKSESAKTTEPKPEK